MYTRARRHNFFYRKNAPRWALVYIFTLLRTKPPLFSTLQDENLLKPQNNPLLMSIFGKLAFWKKEDDFNFDQAANQDMNQPNPFPQDFEHQESAFPPDADFNPSTPQSSPQASPQQYSQASRASLYPGSSVPSSAQSFPSGNREMDLINSKLDTIRAILASIEQRLDRMERTGPEQKPPGRLW